MQISILGIDIGKNSCSVVGVDDREKRERAREYDQFILDKAVHDRFVAMTERRQNPDTRHHQPKIAQPAGQDEPRHHRTDR